jgi:hypothetical protein
MPRSTGDFLSINGSASTTLRIWHIKSRSQQVDVTNSGRDGLGIAASEAEAVAAHAARGLEMAGRTCGAICA